MVRVYVRRGGVHAVASGNGDDGDDGEERRMFKAVAAKEYASRFGVFEEVFEQLDTTPPSPPSYVDEMMFEFKPFKDVFEDTAPAPSYVAANAEELINKFAWTPYVPEPEPQGQQEDSARTFVSTETMFDRKRDANKRSEAVDTSAEPEPEPQGQQDSLGGQSAQLRRSPRLAELAEKRQPIKATGSSILSEQETLDLVTRLCGEEVSYPFHPV
eukprot:COSAG06_NODE_17015_length_966_cov_57.974625_1_plen_214_part_00